MVGFRNIAVEDFQSLNTDIVINIVKNHLKDFKTFSQEIKDSFFNYLKYLIEANPQALANSISRL